MLFSLNGLWGYRCYFHWTDYGGIDVIFIERIMEVYMLFPLNGLWGMDVIFIELCIEKVSFCMHHRGNSPAKRIILKSKLEMCELSIVYGGPILTTMRWRPRPWTQLSNSFPFLTLIIHLYNNWLKLIFFFQIIIIIDLNYVSFSKLPFNNNEN